MRVQNRISINHSCKTVRVCEGGHHGKQTYFPFRRYGSMAQALATAIEYESLIPKDFRTKRKSYSKPFSNSQSGIVGVCPFKNRSGDRAGWRATWTEWDEHGHRCTKTKNFSYHANGKQALRKAIKCRCEMVERQKNLAKTRR